MDARSFERLVTAFESQYEALFGAGSAFREAGIEIMSVRALVTVHLQSSAPPAPTDPLAPAGTRSVVFDDPGTPVDCRVYTTQFPAPGQALDGPALVAYPGQTLVIPPGARALADAFGNVVVTMPDLGEGGL